MALLARRSLDSEMGREGGGAGVLGLHLRRAWLPLQALNVLLVVGVVA